MAKAFDEKERAEIRVALMYKGRELFQVFGLKKTSIDEITAAVGISKGSFYNFFKSKEELFFEIVEEEENFRDDLLTELIAANNDAETTLKTMFTRALDIVDNNKIFDKLYQPGIYEHLLRKLPPEKLTAHQDNDWKAAQDFVEHFQQNGNLRQVEPEVLTGLFRAFFLITLHKVEVGEDIYPRVMELLIDALSRGLVEDKAQ